MIDYFQVCLDNPMLSIKNTKNRMAYIDENTVVIEITHMNKPNDYTIIDAVDAYRCADIRWNSYIDGNVTYVVGSFKNNKMIKLHRYIMFEDPERSDQTIFVDHINRNGLDNRRSNLRFCSNQENQYNTKLPSRNTTGVLGVSYNKSMNSYTASIRIPNGDRLVKSFSANKFSDAFELACQQRKDWELTYR